MIADKLSHGIDVAVVGGGVIGLCVAEALASRGASVAVFEAGLCGAGASAGNAGWISPGLSAPVPAPGTVAKGMRWMFSPTGPLRIRPVPRLSFGVWLLDFWRSTSPRRYRAGMTAMAALSNRVLTDFDALAGRVPHFEAHRDGVLFVSDRESSIAAEEKTLGELRGLGYEGEVTVLDGDAARAHEPALGDDVAGAIFAAAERHLRPESLVESLLVRLRDQGVSLHERHPVRSLAPVSGGWSLDCESGTYAADRVVLAGGAETGGLLRGLGVRLPLLGAKGYSLTRSDSALGLRGPVYLLDGKVAVSPFDGAVRLAGVLELGSRGDSVSRARIASIEAAAGRSFRGWGDSGGWTAWAGMRPMVPDGLPVIGPVPGRRGLHLATGHGMLGVTLAPTTAEVLAPLVLGEGLPPELAPFSIARFA